MNKFKKILPTEITDNTFGLIGNDWMLVTSADAGGNDISGQGYNTMTASWGGLGILWAKPVAFVFIRPQRHTFGYTERNDRITLSFFDEDHRTALAHCGKTSGRDGDKVRDCGLTPVFENTDDERYAWFDEARLVIKGKKLYADMIKEECMTDGYPMFTYKNKDFHKMYIYEVEEVLVRE